MARGVNKVILVGNVGKDPETRYLPSGGAVTNLSIATSESWTDKETNEKKERTEWHNVVFFKKLAEIVSQYVKKGSQLYVEGQLRTRKWEKEGQTHYSTEVVAHDMQMLGGMPRDGQQQRPATNANSQKPAQAAATRNDFEDDDIPF